MTNEEKANSALANLDPIEVAKRLQQRRKQAINNARITDLSRALLVEIQKDLLPNERVMIYHVSHMLNRFGLPHFRSYDKKRFNGITFAFISTGEVNAEVKIYAAFCDKSDTYSRKLGRLEVLDRIQKDLRNIADLRVVYSHTAPDSVGFNVPLAIRRLEDPNYRAIRETTKVKLALASTQRNSELSEVAIASLKEVLQEVNAEVHRHKDDKPNRVNARMFALRKLVKTHF